MNNIYDDNPNTIYVTNESKSTSTSNTKSSDNLKPTNNTTSHNSSKTSYSNNKSINWGPIIIVFCIIGLTIAIITFSIGRTSGIRETNIELAKLKSEIVDLKQKNELTEQTISTSESNIDSNTDNGIEEEIFALKNQVQELTKSNQELSNKVKENEKIIDEKKNLDNEVSSLKSQVQNLTKTNQDLNNKVKNLENSKSTTTYTPPTASSTTTTKNNNGSSTKEITDNAKLSDVVDITSVKVKKGTPTVWTEYDLTISGTIHSEKEISSIDFTVEAYNANGEAVSLANSISYSSAPGPLTKYSASKTVSLNNPSSNGAFSFTWNGALLNENINHARVTNIKVNYKSASSSLYSYPYLYNY